MTAQDARSTTLVNDKDDDDRTASDWIGTDEPQDSATRQGAVRTKGRRGRGGGGGGGRTHRQRQRSLSCASSSSLSSMSSKYVLGGVGKGASASGQPAAGSSSGVGGNGLSLGSPDDAHTSWPSLESPTSPTDTGAAVADPSSHLVFSPLTLDAQLDVLFGLGSGSGASQAAALNDEDDDHLGTGSRRCCRPHARPTLERDAPAKCIYLMAKYAQHLHPSSHQDAQSHDTVAEEYLATLLESVVERVEERAAAGGDSRQASSLPVLAWLARNMTLLTHLIRSDSGRVESAAGVIDDLSDTLVVSHPLSLAQLAEQTGTLALIEEMTASLHVHIVRLVESKLDRLIEPALLERDPMSGAPAVSGPASSTPFRSRRVTDDDEDAAVPSGDWSIFRSLAARGKTTATRAVSAAFASVSSSASSPGRASTSAETSSLESPARTPARRLRASASTLFGPLKAAITSTARSQPTIPAVLGATLTILRLYDLNPALIIQSFSQILLWLASEVFNRILLDGDGQKRYLSREAAMRVRINLEAIGDWVRSTGDLPPGLFSTHFRKVLHLLQWLQCASSLDTLDALLVTIAQLGALNPLQLRRAIRDYCHEPNEPRMNDECLAYLAQLQRDWEREALKTHGRRSTISSAGVENDPEPTAVDALFDSDQSLASYVPPTAPPSYGELEDARFMLTIELPSGPRLGARPPRGAAYRAMDAARATMTMTTQRREREHRPLSISSAASHGPSGQGSTATLSTSSAATRAMPYRLTSTAKARRLPDAFLPWFATAQVRGVEATDLPVAETPASSAAPNATSSSTWKAALGWTPSVDRNMTPTRTRPTAAMAAATPSASHPATSRRSRPESLNLFSSTRRPSGISRAHHDRYLHDENQPPPSSPPPPKSAPAGDGIKTSMAFDPYARQHDVNVDDSNGSKRGSWWQRAAAAPTGNALAVNRARQASLTSSVSGDEMGGMSSEEEEQQQGIVAGLMTPTRASRRGR